MACDFFVDTMRDGTTKMGDNVFHFNLVVRDDIFLDNRKGRTLLTLPQATVASIISKAGD